MFQVAWKWGLPCITTERLTLRIGDVADVDSEIAFYRENEEHFRPWYPDNSNLHLNRSAMRRYVPELRRRALGDQGYRFRISRKEEPSKFAGLVSLSRIQRGSEQSAVLGYGIAKDLEGQGYMSESVRATVRFAFEVLDLHRLEAYYATNNERSGYVLKACGFEMEGTKRGMLRVNGIWIDHIMAAKINPEWKGGQWR